MNPPTILFDLTEEQVHAALTAAVGVPVVHVSIPNSTKAEEGISSETRRVTFDYHSEAGEPGEITLYVKRCLWQGRSESVHYQHFATHGVPTPHLYSVFRNPQDEEIIFLEALAATSYARNSPAEWRAMLALLARLNACPITSDYEQHLIPYAQIGQAGGGVWITGFAPSLTAEEIEYGWEACQVPPSDRPRLTQAAQALFARVAAQPTGLLHLDFMSGNFGWRADRTEALVFDLHKNARGPRFADVAPYLSVPDWSQEAAFLDGTVTDGSTLREELTGHYLDEYARSGGPRVSPKTFQAETTDLFWAHKVAIIPWLAEQGHAERVQAILTFLRR